MSRADAKDFSAILTLDAPKDPIVIPKTFVVQVDLSYPRAYRPDKEAMLDHLLQQQGTSSTSPFSLADIQESAIEDSGQILETIRYQLEPLLPGKYALTLFEVPFSSSSLEPTTVEVVSTIAYVNVALPENTTVDLNAESATLLDLSLKEPIELDSRIRTSLAEDYSPYYERLFQSKAFPWQPLGALLALFLIFIWVKRMSKKQKQIPLAISGELAAMQLAEEQLKVLQAQPQPKKENVESFVVNLSKGVRYHFEEKLKMPILSQSSEEFLRDLEKNPNLDQAHKKLVQNFLQSTDRIKFADYQPTMDECLQAQTAAEQILKEL